MKTALLDPVAALELLKELSDEFGTDLVAGYQLYLEAKSANTQRKADKQGLRNMESNLHKFFNKYELAVINGHSVN